MVAACHINSALIFPLLVWLCAGHYLPQPEDLIQGVHTNGKHVLKRRSIEQSLRIKVYTQSRSLETLEASKKSLIVDRLLAEAVAYFGKTLQVHRATLPVRLQRNCKHRHNSIMKMVNGNLLRFCVGECNNETKCGMVRIPEAHLDVCRTCADRVAATHCTTANETASAGVKDADFVLYVSADMTSQCKTQNDVIAYATACQQEHGSDRPVAGFVNFCEKKLSGSATHYPHLLAIVKHEIFHALGFSSSLYGYYRDDDGTPLTSRGTDGRPLEKWSDKVVKEVVRNRWRVSDSAGSFVRHTVEMIVTPHVLREVRAHFNCSNLEGAEIENQGATGQRQTHWEKRLFENEAMTGIFTSNPVFSRLTLALMEDTGWYVANYKMAEILDWGRNAGCLFAQSSCRAWMDKRLGKGKSVTPYCMEVGASSHTRTACTVGYDGVGYCNLVKYNTPLPVEYTYFDFLPGTDEPGHYGGSTALADYCPFIHELEWKMDGSIRGSNCKHVTNSLTFKRNYALEEYGPSSLCFLHGQAWTRMSCKRTVTAVDWGSGCYSYLCTKGGLVVSVMGHSYPCLYPGEELKVGLLEKMSWLYTGSLICPPCRDLCGELCPSKDNVTIVKTHLRNVTSHQRSSQQVLVCSSSEINPSLFRFLVGFIFVYLHIVEIRDR